MNNDYRTDWRAGMEEQYEKEQQDPKVNTDWGKFDKKAALQAMSTGGNSTADIASKGMIMSGNPYLMGAGLGMQVLSANKKREQERYNQIAQAENQRRANLANSLAAMASIYGKMRLW